ncbi:MAG: hypothetical protein GC200_05805 [Tepidisphaera sp.]|nr:hypothetical protein [Tepidisphaera sp.]
MDSPSSHRSARFGSGARAARPAFSLIELVVVIGIIVLLISIILPALSVARRASKVAATNNEFNEVSNAIAQFKQDQNRLPGYFSARDLGDSQNATPQGGFTPMQNVMLELVGGIVSNQQNPTGPDIATVGPTSGKTVKVRVDSQSGMPSENLAKYFQPKPSYFKKQDGVNGGKRYGTTDNSRLAELVDAFGQPVLMWMADPTATGTIQSLNGANDNALARSSAPTGANTPPARFYWASNGAFLANNATLFVGDQRKLQVTNSFITPDNASYVKNLSVLFGSPTAAANVAGPYDQIVPAAIRGSYILQSAGQNFYYMGLKETQLANAASSGQLLFGLNFKDAGNNFVTDANGKTSSTDIMTKSDDIILAGN